MSQKQGIDFCIYTTSSCNFDCSYCRNALNRGKVPLFIKDDDIPKIIKYFKKYAKNCTNITFHGGEVLTNPFILEKLILAFEENFPDNNYLFCIQTNGSLIAEKQQVRDFIIRWRHKLLLSISYDFCTQNKNRSKIDIDFVLTFLKDQQIITNLQSVIDINDREQWFDFDHIKFISNIYKKYNIDTLVFITLRCINGEKNVWKIFDTLTPETINDYFTKLISFLSTLYIHGIKFLYEGHEFSDFPKDVTKSNTIIISPDGFVYPDFDFLETRNNQYALYDWRNDKPMDSNFDLKDPECINCPISGMCGVKYHVLLKDFEITNPVCQLFFNYHFVLYTFLNKLQSKDTFIEHFIDD